MLLEHDAVVSDEWEYPSTAQYRMANRLMKQIA
jgi:hypothetical protein